LYSYAKVTQSNLILNRVQAKNGRDRHQFDCVFKPEPCRYIG